MTGKRENRNHQADDLSSDPTVKPLAWANSLAPQRRRGAVLVTFAILLFALLALAALIVNVGLMFSNRRQMQAAVNSAALDGLRFRNEISQGALDAYLLQYGDSSISTTSASALTAADREVVRRSFAAARAAQVLPAYVGPDLSGGTTVQVGGIDVEASQLIQGTSSAAVALQPNNSNAAGGDMVAGTYNAATSSHLESVNTGYSRDDFAAADGSDSTIPTSSFLVRMRRSAEGFDGSDGAHSSGPLSPAFFNGIGMAVTSGGFTVRATAIADAVAAISVFMPRTYLNASGSSATLAGFLPGFQLRADTDPSWSSTTYSPWQTDSSGQSLTLTATISGTTITDVATGTTVGNLATLSALVGSSGITMTSVCVGMETSTTSAATISTGIFGFAPLVSNFPTSTGSGSFDVIVGFVPLTATSSGANYLLTRSRNFIAAENASARFPSDPTSVSILSQSCSQIDLSAVMQMRRTIAPPATAATATHAFPLLAPALVRTIGSSPSP